MTNAEKRGKEIIAQECETGSWAVEKYTNEIMACTTENCDDCLFMGDCNKKAISWLNSEYIDKSRRFSEKDKEVLRALDKVQWVARNGDGILYGAYKKPCRVVGVWCCAGHYITNLSTLTTAEFAPVKMEDDEPTSREEILGEEE